MNQTIREFNAKVQNLLENYSDENESLLNRSLSLICTSQNILNLNANNVENCQFYINLYKIIRKNFDKKDSDVLWSSIAILQQTAKNLDTRNAIINKFKYFPLLAKLLQKLNAQEKIERVLNLMQDLSYGIKITWEESYLSDLIKTLLREIYAEDNNELAYISLSVLINICYKNIPVICLLMKSINPTSFSEKIKHFGILANKMMIILDINNISSVNAVDFNLFIKQSFIEIEKAIQCWNVSMLQHIVNFLIDCKDHRETKLALSEYTNFGKDIENLIQAVNVRLEMDDDSNRNEEHLKNLQLCFSLIFQFLTFIIKITNHELNLLTIPNCNIEFIFQWLDAKYACEQTIILIETIVKIVDDDFLLKIMHKFNNECIEKLLQIAENNEYNSKFTSLLQKLLIVLLERDCAQQLILSTVTESYFDKIFAPLLDIKSELIILKNFHIDDIAKYSYCFQLLTKFSQISKIAWIDKVNNLFEQKQLQFVLAKGMLIENESLCNAVFEISKIENFPQMEIAKLMTQLSKISITHSFSKNSSENNEVLCSGKSNHFDNFYEAIAVSKDCEERLNALIEKIHQSNQNSEFDTLTSELIEIFNYKTIMLKNKVENLTQRLDRASDENTNLSHELSFNNIELEKYHNINFEMHFKQERLQTEMKDLKKQNFILRDSVEKLGKKFKEDRLQFKNNSKVLEVKMAEIIDLRKELTTLKEKDEVNCETIEKLQTLADKNNKRVEQLRQSLVLTEKQVTEISSKLQNKEKEATQFSKKSDELSESLKKSENIIKHLENQISEKNETIRCLEKELNETEEMRKTILSLMESKKPKRNF